MTKFPGSKNFFWLTGLIGILALSLISFGCGGRGVETIATTTTAVTTTTLPGTAAPVFSLASGSYEAAYLTVTIESTTASAEIFYTLDGSDPTSASTKYAAAFTIEASKVIRALATKAGLASSAITAANYDVYWWSPLGTGVGGSGTIVPLALAIDSSDNLYVGGLFQTAGGVLVNNIAKWSASAQTWEALKNSPSGIGTDDSVNSLAIDNFGNLYAGGSFTVAGGVSASRVARWNGSAWEALGTGASGTVYSVILDSATSQNLYVGGESIITKCSDLYASPNWSSLGNVLGRVTCLALDNAGDLHMGGLFTSVSGVSAQRLAKRKFTPATWEVLGNPNNDVYTLAFDDKASQNLYVGGYFTTVPGNYVNYIARRNSGGTWFPVGSGMDTSVGTLLYDDSNNLLYAGGGFYQTADGIVTLNHIGTYDPATGRFGALGTGTDNTILSIARDSAGNIYAAGWFTKAGGITVNQVARWGKK